MKPNELYKREPESTSMELGNLKGFYYNHLPEIEEELWNVDNKKIYIKYYKDHCFDGRRVWQLASVWYRDIPVMIIQNAGREGDDHAARYITNIDAYVDMIQYIKSLLPNAESWIKDVYGADEDIDGLTKFYRYSLDGHFDRY